MEYLGSDLVFLIDNKISFELPLQDVSNTNLVAKNEVSIEFNPEQQAGNGDDELIEIRFFIPTPAIPGRKNSAISQTNNDEPIDLDKENEDDPMDVDEVHKEDNQNLASVILCF